MKHVIKYTIECIPEDMEIRGNCLASGDAAFDKECEDKIIADLESGNPWAWCSIEVTAYIPGIEDISGVDTLGGCSYASEEDFKKNSYFQDMKDNARDDLLLKIRRIKAIRLESVQ